MKARRKRQSGKTGSKRWFSSGCVNALSKWVEKEASRDNCSYSLVVMNCIAIVSGIEAETVDSKTSTIGQAMRKVIRKSKKKALAI